MMPGFLDNTTFVTEVIQASVVAEAKAQLAATNESINAALPAFRRVMLYLVDTARTNSLHRLDYFASAQTVGLLPEDRVSTIQATFATNTLRWGRKLDSSGQNFVWQLGNE
jgi:hypothetical protein